MPATATVPARLTKAARKRLSQCETIIESGLGAFYSVGQALAIIREEQLYREEYGTFADYCRSRWGFEDRYARYLIGSCDVLDELRRNNCSVLPATESQARPLLTIDLDQVGAVWQEVLKRAPKLEDDRPKITAALVAETVKWWTTPPDELRERGGGRGAGGGGEEESGEGAGGWQPAASSGEGAGGWQPAASSGEPGVCPSSTTTYQSSSGNPPSRAPSPEPRIPNPEAPDLIWTEVEDAVREWIGDDPARRAIAAARLENLATKMRDEGGWPSDAARTPIPESLIPSP